MHLNSRKYAHANTPSKTHDPFEITTISSFTLEPGRSAATMSGDTSFGFQSLYRAVSSTTGGTPSSVSLRSPSLPDYSFPNQSSPGPDDSDLQSLCNRATVLGNDISVRLVDLLTTVKNRPAGVQKLATEFLEISRILWSIEINLARVGRREGDDNAGAWGPHGEEVTGGALSPGMAGVLDSRLRQTIRDFTALDHLLGKCLDAEKKGPVARLQARWRKLFADRDLDKMKTSLRSARDSLRASALAFQCSPKDNVAEASIGTGYNGLATALDTSEPKRPRPGARSMTTSLQSLGKKKRNRSVMSLLDELPTGALSDSEKESEMPSPGIQRGSQGAESVKSSRIPLHRRSVSDWGGSPKPIPAERSRPLLSPIHTSTATANDHVVEAPPTPPETNDPRPSHSRGTSEKMGRPRPSLTNPNASFSSSLGDAEHWMDERKKGDVSGGEKKE
ncbi:hypothetical protein IMZ48_02585, partial [Candidatus Bathyarchaeota archaeon]|nr:hypothetical protein [Candidatus Bathyarchaeota archaeon]